MVFWIVLAIIAFLASIVLYASDQPGYRRRRQNSKYDGLERREDDTAADAFSKPIFKLYRCAKSDKVRHEQSCLPEEHDHLKQEPSIKPQK